MIDNYELLKCDICGKEFKGRRPAEGGVIFCSEYLKENLLPIIYENEPYPDSVSAEIENGRGCNDE